MNPYEPPRSQPAVWPANEIASDKTLPPVVLLNVGAGCGVFGFALLIYVCLACGFSLLTDGEFSASEMTGRGKAVRGVGILFGVFAACGAMPVLYLWKAGAAARRFKEIGVAADKNAALRHLGGCFWAAGIGIVVFVSVIVLSTSRN